MVDTRRDSSYLFPNSDGSSAPGLAAVKSLIADVGEAFVSIANDTQAVVSDTWQRRTEILRERSDALVASFSALNAVRFTPYVLLFLLAFLPAVILGSGFQGAFNSPDETTRYLAAQNFAETGSLYLEDEITTADPQYSTGTRGFAQHNGRSVPTYSQLPLMVLGIATYLFGGAAPLVLAAIPGALFVSLALMVKRIFPDAAACGRYRSPDWPTLAPPRTGAHIAPSTAARSQPR